MSGRCRYAVYGDALPDGRRPFRCPDCGTLVGHSQRVVLQFGGDSSEVLLRSELENRSVHVVGTSPEGLPIYGWRRGGHSPRRRNPARQRLAAERYTRLEQRDLDNQPDYALIERSQFETWCPACGARLRVDAAAAV